ncbi:MAG: hypothetical protein EPN93_08260 [Spirochaetes bacterium]|nr:MAG: hypothetical protein EPN93_08260 [Spirochaetota bacterium]
MKKSELTRSTRRCKYDDLQNEFKQAVRDFIVTQKLGEMKGMTMHCFETTTDFKSRLWGKLQQFTDLILSPQWFFWGLSGDRIDTTEGCARIKDIAGTIDFENQPEPDCIVVCGINISGFTYDESRLYSWRLYLAHDETGEEFRRELRKAVGGFSKKPPVVKSEYR